MGTTRLCSAWPETPSPIASEIVEAVTVGWPEPLLPSLF